MRFTFLLYFVVQCTIYIHKTVFTSTRFLPEKWLKYRSNKLAAISGPLTTENLTLLGVRLLLRMLSLITVAHMLDKLQGRFIVKRDLVILTFQDRLHIAFTG